MSFLRLTRHLKKTGSTDLEFKNKPSFLTGRKSRALKFHLPALALAVERKGVSDRAATVIANATLEDILISDENKEKVIDWMALRQGVKKRKRLKHQESSTS